MVVYFTNTSEQDFTFKCKLGTFLLKSGTSAVDGLDQKYVTDIVNRFKPFITVKKTVEADSVTDIIDQSLTKKVDIYDELVESTETKKEDTPVYSTLDPIPGAVEDYIKKYDMKPREELAVIRSAPEGSQMELVKNIQVTDTDTNADTNEEETVEVQTVNTDTKADIEVEDLEDDVVIQGVENKPFNGTFNIDGKSVDTATEGVGLSIIKKKSGKKIK